MQMDTLFLLKPGFFDGDRGPFVCTESAKLVGYLSLYPEVARAITVRQLAFRRPRAELVALLGEAHQACPVLVISDVTHTPASAAAKVGHGRRFITDANAIISYLGTAYGAPVPH